MKTLYIFNTQAKKARFLKAKIKKTLENMGLSGQFAEVSKRGEAQKIASLALTKDIDRVVAIGGDGMINDIIQVLAYQPIEFGVIPIGDNNLVAHLIGINSWMNGCMALKNGETIEMDLGLYDDRYFTASIEIEGKQTAKKSGFIASRLKKPVISYYPMTIDLKKEGSSLHIQADISRLTISPFPFGGRGHSQDFLTDQLLHIQIKSRPEDLNNKKTRPETTVVEGDYLEISGKTGLQIKADGENSGKTPVVIKVAPKALKVLVPQDKNATPTSNLAQSE
ncbi:MAG: diacylglycerol kinase family protein [Patescibacteria group bacterium]